MNGRDVGLVLALMTASITIVGCFDVRAVDPGPAVLDDFEDGNQTPSLPPFTGWTCQTFQPEGALDCDLTPGFDSKFSLSAAFTIADMPDGIQQHGGVLVAAFADQSVDLSGLSTATFAVRLTSSTKPLPPKSLMHMDFLCSTAVGENGAALVNFALVQSIAFTDEWSTVTLSISNFGPAPWQTEHIKGGAPACLRAVDGIQFVFDAAVPDGQSSGGTLSIDEVRLQ